MSNNMCFYEFDSYKSRKFLYFNHTRTNSFLSLIAVQQQGTQTRIKTYKGNYYNQRNMIFILVITNHLSL